MMRLVPLAGLFVALLQQPGLPPRTPVAPGQVHEVVVHGASLEGNLLGVPADRRVSVYLPPSYATSGSKPRPRSARSSASTGSRRRFRWRTVRCSAASSVCDREGIRRRDSSSSSRCREREGAGRTHARKFSSRSTSMAGSRSSRRTRQPCSGSRTSGQGGWTSSAGPPRPSHRRRARPPRGASAPARRAGAEARPPPGRSA